MWDSGAGWPAATPARTGNGGPPARMAVTSRAMRRRDLASMVSPLLALLIACNETSSAPPTQPPSPAEAVTAAAPPAFTATAPAAPPWNAAPYRTAIDAAIDAAFAADPIWATRLGVHRFDDQLPDLSDGAQQAVAIDLTARAKTLRALASGAPAESLVAEAGTDRPALDATLLADRLDQIAFGLTTFRPLERDPSDVLVSVGMAVTGLTNHDYAPKHARIDALATRLAHVPALLDVAHARVKQPSRAALENTAIVAKGLTTMLRGPAVAEWQGGLENDAPLQARVAKGAADAAVAIDGYLAAVQRAFPIAAAKDAPIGTEMWSQLARLHEGVTDAPADIRAIGEKELARLQGELDALITQAVGGGEGRETRAAFFTRLEKDTPPEDGVLTEYRAAEKRVEDWMHAHPVATVPWDKAKLEVVPTPPYQRGISFASMNVAGIFEPSVSDARLEVNEPQASMPAARRLALLHFNAKGAIDLVTLHEGMPGHYLMSLYARAASSKVRKITWNATLSEGWAHYCEQMALENRYPAPDAVRMRAFYLRMALQRAARVVIDVAENDGSMSLADGAKFLEDNAMLAPEAAKIEARRAVVRPANMFSYTYGKLAILKIRDAVKAREGASFDLQRFHDRLLSIGYGPVKTVGEVAFGVK
jgi:uncharacterized protein (DUF885 family)